MQRRPDGKAAERRAGSLAATLEQLKAALQGVQRDGGWPACSLHLLGFSQGGTAALHLASTCRCARRHRIRFSWTVKIGTKIDFRWRVYAGASIRWRPAQLVANHMSLWKPRRPRLSATATQAMHIVQPFP